MSLKVALTRFQSRDLMGLHDVKLDVVDRPCPVGDDPQSILLVKNGPLEMRYSPAFNHHYFSRLPTERWFSDYYAAEWMTGDIRKRRNLAHTLLHEAKKPARIVRSAMKKLLGMTSLTEAVIQWDINRYCMLLRPYLWSGGQVLDVGCGSGEFLQPYVKAGIRCAGIEPSEISAKIARARHINVLNSPLKDTAEVRQLLASSDVIFSNHSLEHHYDPNRFFRLCSEEMKEGAILSVTVPNSDAEVLLLQNLYLLHIDGYTAQSLEHMFNKYGFKILHKEEGQQLRFVAIKKKGLETPKHKKSCDPIAFSMQYQKQYIEQIAQLHGETEPREGKILPFNFGYKGARPYTRWGYDVYFSDFPKEVRRFVEGEIVRMPGTQSALINYETSNASTARILLK